MSASNDIRIKITIDGDTKNVTLVRNEVNKLGNSINNVDTYANALRSTLGKFAAVGFAINGLSDAFTKSIASIDALANATGRLSLVAKNSNELKALSAQILNVANSARVSFTETTDLYTRFANNLKNSAISSKQMIEVTQAVSKSLVISGASAQSANAALIQLSQGLAANSLRGQELASVMEQTPRLAQAIADGMNVSIGQLRKLAEENKLTTETVFFALYKQKDLIEKEFGKMPITIGQSMTVLGNSVQALLGRLNEASGFTKAITGATIGLSNAFSGLSVYAEQVSSAVWLLVKGFATYKASVIGANLYTSLFNKTMNGMYTNSFIASLSRAGSVMDVLKVGAGAAATAFKTLRGAMMSVLPVAGIMLAIEVVGRLAESFGGAKERNEELRKSIELTSEEIKKLSVNELNNHLITLAKEQDSLIRSIEGSEYALSRLDEEFQDEEQRAQAFDAITAGAGKFESRLEMVKDRIKEIKEQIEGLSNPNSAKGQFLQASAFIDKILDDHKNIKTKIDIEDEIKLEVERITKLSELTGITAENERNYLNAKEKTLAKLIKLNDEYENFGKEKTKKLKDHTNILKSALKDIAEVNFSDMELKTQRVIDRYNEMLSLGIDKGKAKHFLNSKLEAIANENIKAVEKSEAEAIAKQLDLRAQYYKTIGEYENAWQIEKQKIIEKYEKLTFANGEKLTKEQLDKLLKMEKTAFLQGSKIAKNSFKDIKGSWADTVSTMSKTVEDGFFNLFMRKTKDLKSALKDIGQNLFRDFMSPYARNLSQGIGGLFGSFLGGGSNLAQLASFYGLSKSDTGSFVGEVAGTAVEIASDGTIVKGGSAFGGASNILSMASNLKSAYTMLTNGYSGLVSNFTTAPAGYLSSYLSSAGYTGASFGIQGLGVGAQHALTGNLITGGGLNGTLSGAYGAGYIGGATLAGGALGYGVGTLGDRLFKANSYASSVGAVGGALGGAASAGAFGAKIGSMVGPWGAVIGAVAGALIGGMFGKKKAIGTGISVNQDFTTSTQLNSEIIRGYVQMQKKGWFSKKEWKDYHDLGADILGDISSQVKQMEKLALRAGAITSLTIKKGAYSGNSFSDTAITKAIISAMTGLDQEIWAEQISTNKKRKGFLGKLTNVYDKIMKYSPSTLANKATRPLDNALGRIMNKNGLGALHDQSIAGRVEIGDISDGKILDFEPTKKLEEKLGIIQEIQTKNMRQIVNPEIERMFQDWQEIAKKEKKNINEVITASLVSITDTYKSLALISQKNPLKQAQINIELMFEEFKDAAEGLKVEIPKNLSSIAELSVEEMASAYRKAIANDFTKENIDGLNSLVKVYQEARKAQDDFTKSIISFTGQIANTQGGFYQAHGINTSFLAQQATYTKFRTLLSSLNGDISKEEKDSIGKFGEFGNIQTWSKYLLSMTARDMQGFMSSGNTELRNELIATITEYQRQIQANGGKEFWLKSFTDIENIDKQIAALKLAKQTEEAIKVHQEKAQREMEIQREQLSILNLQRAAVEKIGSIAQRIRNQVIDRTTSPINYANALKAAKEAYARGDYRSKAFDNLSEAADHQRQFFEDTLSSYEEYKLSMLTMASEIEAISEKTTLADINAAIESLEKELEKTKKTLDEEMKKANSLAENQIFALEQQRMQLIQNSQNEIKALDSLLGTNAPLILYLRGIMEQLLNKDRGALENGKKEENNGARIKAPIYTGGVENINTTATTANGAILTSALDQNINQLYLSILGRSADQSGLEYWRGVATKQNLSMAQISEEIIKAATAQFGTSDREIWKQMQKGFGLKPFADGGIVTRPTRALIGEAGYNEAIIPLKDGRGVKVDMDGGFELLSNTMNRLEQVSQKIEKNTKELVLFLRGVISEDGEKIQTKALA